MQDENIVWKMAGILSRPQCVDKSKRNDDHVRIHHMTEIEMLKEI